MSSPSFTDEEKRAIQALRRLAKKWPPSLRLVLIQQTGDLHVARAEDCDAADDLATVPKVGLCERAFKVDSFA